MYMKSKDGNAISGPNGEDEDGTKEGSDNKGRRKSDGGRKSGGGEQKRCRGIYCKKRVLNGGVNVKANDEDEKKLLISQ